MASLTSLLLRLHQFHTDYSTVSDVVQASNSSAGLCHRWWVIAKHTMAEYDQALMHYCRDAVIPNPQVLPETTRPLYFHRMAVLHYLSQLHSRDARHTTNDSIENTAVLQVTVLCI